mgnify:CR=1 FL=1
MRRCPKENNQEQNKDQDQDQTEILECKLCNYVTDIKSNYRRYLRSVVHIADTSNIAVKENITYECSLCE